MDYKIENLHVDVGFKVSGDSIFRAVLKLNTFLEQLPPSLYRSVDFKTTGALIGAVFCTEIVSVTEGSMINPIEKGYPDIIPIIGKDATEEELRNYPEGLEIKGTVGNVKKNTGLKAGEQRIGFLSGVTWQAHHRDGKILLGFIWDFVNEKDGFLYPAITAVYFTDSLTTEDWGEISGTTGRNTKVTGLRKSGKIKLAKGRVLIYDNKEYIEKYKNLME